jgi:hypothetical protein
MAKIVRCGKITILGVIKGLVSESFKVRETYRKVRPQIIAVSISTEELDALKKWDGTEVYTLSEYEEIYAMNLKRYGDVKAPPPCFVETVNISKEYDIPIIAVDIPESLYTKMYCAYVSGSEYIRHMLRKRFIKQKKFRYSTPEEFVIAWDKTVNNLKGFRRIETKREEYIFKELVKLGKKYSTILAVVDFERAEGVHERFMQIK